MRHHSNLLLVTASLAALAFAGNAFAGSAGARAQQPATAAPAADAGADDTIVVTGTRAANRTRLDTIAPVDVISADALRQQGSPELGAALAAVTPSLDFPRPAGNDGSDAIRPAVLRGLSPDETLVLINGVRTNAAAYLNVNGALGRGAAAVDLNTIPNVALETVEVLRDGASAQYGSDAIAGVVNLRLKQADHGGGITASQGIYATNFTTARTATRSVIGEPVTAVSAWQGMKLGHDGFLTISGDYQRRSMTNRIDADARTGTVIGVYGDPKVEQYSGWANFGKPVDDNWQLYGWFGYQYRNSTSAATARPTNATVVSASGSDPALTAGQLAPQYANGFLPLINTHSFDIKSALGIKGDVAGWNVNAKVSYGRNEVKLWTLNSTNYSYGPTSQANFYDGKFTYSQVVGGLDATREFAVFKSLNVAWGVEVRHESYGIGAGEVASYADGGYYAGQSTPWSKVPYGAVGYGGLSAANAISVHRTSESAYLDLEAQVTDKLRLGAAGRFEHYSDFGSTGTGKVSARYDVSPAFALRATGSTGFRAPGLQQEYYTAVSSVLNSSSGTIQLTGTYPATSAIATQLGGKALQPERAASVSGGFVVQKGAFNLTVDGYYTHVRNALALSENLSCSVLNTAGCAALSAAKVSAARFFINGLGITARGIDAVAHYKLRTAAVGTFDLTVAGNVNRMEVTNTPALPAALTSLGLFGRSRVMAITTGSPGEKVTGQIDWAGGKIGATARVTYYGNVVTGGSTAAGDYSTGIRAITDLELRYQPKETMLNLALGANNLFDVYPRALTASQNSGTNGLVAFPYYSPYGFNGRYVYVRAGLHW
ncbi:MAG TPA: TonB-dependent receptor [Novosphingobium sp.]|nr:TonB-dependent receptor [Novosphingobium sp.]